MTWSDPTTRSTGDLITAAIWNQDVVDNGQFLKDLAASVAVLQDQKSSGTDGGDFTSGAWRTRDLNTEVSDPQGIVSLDSNQFTPAAGDYLLMAWAPARKVNQHQIRLYNATQTAQVAAGLPAKSGSGDDGANHSFLTAVFTADGSDAYEIQHRCQTTSTGQGFGQSGGWITEAYTTVLLIRLGE